MKFNIVIAELDFKCVRIHENPKPNSNGLKLLICDFADDNGNKVSNVHVRVPHDKPMPFKEGDLCRLLCDFRQSDVAYVGIPLDDKALDEAAGTEW